MSLNKTSGLAVFPALMMTLMLSACSTSEPAPASKSTPLPYQVTLSATPDDRMQCENCGNSGEKVLIKDGEKLSQYTMMVDSPYFVFLCNNSTAACRTGSWIAINKNLVRPYPQTLSLGGQTLITDLRPANDAHHTWLQVTYANGEQNVFTFDNNK
ncbi:hypothetical protein [Enterobacter cloacae]|uniref:hypothetical protein n=2 Tax=Enterobacteriaceae TaxID=543 RepID=UPI0013D4ACAB|nr:hypothetical protein [Enterobacter cloacae]MBF4109651.1 hypothetical protein [Enterobacter cloacae]MDT8891891.1 hypothetical protein [Enterobacter cloacae]